MCENEKSDQFFSFSFIELRLGEFALFFQKVSPYWTVNSLYDLYIGDIWLFFVQLVKKFVLF